MIISDAHRFVFIHIPKCAGTMVREQLLPIDSHGGRFTRVEEHPSLGPLDLPHLPLRVLAAHFPEQFAKVRDYRAVALLRDPRDRFVSSLMERMRTWRHVPGWAPTRAALIGEAEQVIRHLEGRGLDVGLKYSHFIPQDAYVRLDGERLVDALFGIDQLEAFARYVETTTGVVLKTAEKVNASQVPRNALLRTAVRVAKPFYLALLPEPARRRVRSGVVNSFLYRDATDQFGAEVLGNRTVADFVASYYEADARLFAALPRG